MTKSAASQNILALEQNGLWSVSGSGGTVARSYCGTDLLDVMVVDRLATGFNKWLMSLARLGQY